MGCTFPQVPHPIFVQNLIFDSGARANYYPDTAMRAYFFSSRHFAIREKAIHTGVWIVLAMLSAPPAIAAPIPHPHHQPKQIVRIIERKERHLQQAEVEANTATIASMLSDDYLGIYADGTLATKPETIASFKSGATHFTTINTSDRKIRIFGSSTAVVVSKAVVIGKIGGEEVNGHYRYTRVYHRANGVWKVVSFEASALREKPKAHISK